MRRYCVLEIFDEGVIRMVSIHNTEDECMREFYRKQDEVHPSMEYPKYTFDEVEDTDYTEVVYQVALPASHNSDWVFGAVYRDLKEAEEHIIAMSKGDEYQRKLSEQSVIKRWEVK